MLLLLAACAQQETEVYHADPILPAAVYAPPDYDFETNSFHDEVVLEQASSEPEDLRIAVVRQFIENQNSDNIYEYAEGLRKNLEITGGEMYKIVENEWEIYSERADMTRLFFELKQKGEDVFTGEQLEKLQNMYEGVYKPRMDLGVIYDKPTFEYGGMKGGEAYIIVRAKEYNNIPGQYFVKDVEDTYVVAEIDGQWKVVALKNGEEKLTYASLWKIWHALRYDNSVEDKNLDGLRMTIGLMQ